MKRVLVTGATGFIGQNTLTPLLERGYEVHALNHAAVERPSGSSVVWHRCDLLAPGSAQKILGEVGPTHLLHLAWYAEPGKYWRSIENLVWLRASLDLLGAFASAQGGRVVIAGTCAEYDWDYGFLSEDVTPVCPSSLYGTCKNGLRDVLEKIAAISPLSWAWGRIFYLYGPCEAPARLVPSVVLALLRGEQARCSSGAQIRDFLHVEDVARAFVMLLDSEVQGAVNIGSGEPVTVRHIVNTLGSRLQGAERIEFGAIATAASEPPLLVADSRRLRNEVGWRPKWRLDEGLAATVDWWRDRISGGKP